MLQVIFTGMGMSDVVQQVFAGKADVGCVSSPPTPPPAIPILVTNPPVRPSTRHHQ